MQEAWIQYLSQEEPVEEGMTTHSSILAWRIPWTETPGSLQPIGSQRVRHNWSDLAHTHTKRGKEVILFLPHANTVRSCPLQARKWTFRWDQFSQQLDLGLSASRTARNKYLEFKSPCQQCTIIAIWADDYTVKVGRQSLSHLSGYEVIASQLGT